MIYDLEIYYTLFLKKLQALFRGKMDLRKKSKNPVTNSHRRQRKQSPNSRVEGADLSKKIEGKTGIIPNGAAHANIYDESSEKFYRSNSCTACTAADQKRLFSKILVAYPIDETHADSSCNSH
jgi:hypothetical protein